MPDAKERLQQAISAARTGDTAEAKEMVELLLEDYPDNAHALFLRGMLAGSQAEQIDYLERVLVVDPNHQAAKRRLAQIAPAVEEALAEEVVEELSEQESEPIVEVGVQEEYGDLETAGEPAVVSGLEEEGDEPVEQPVEEPPEEEPEEPSEEPAEFGIAETIVTAAAIGAGLESVEDDATIFAPRTSEEDSEPEEPVEEAAEEVEPAEPQDATVLASKPEPGVAPESEPVPAWLKAEAPTEELSALPETQTWADQPEEEEQEIPDWLSETPVEEEELPVWLTQEPEEEWVEDTMDETAIYVSEGRVEPVDQVFEEEEAFIGELPEEIADAADEAGEEVVEEIEEGQRPTSSGTRGLEITLIVLVLIAFVIVSVLLYVISTRVF